MSKKFIAILLGAFVLVGGLFFWTLYSGGFQLPSLSSSNSSRNNPGTVPSPVVAPLLPPNVTITIEKSASGNALVVNWQNLLANTVALDILRRLTKDTKAPWVLWKQITLTKDELANGNARFNIGTLDLGNYSFSVETVGNITDANGTPVGETITWVSSSTVPTTTITPPAPTSTSGENPPQNTPTTTPTTTVTITTTTNNNPGQPNASTTTTSTPSGTPYYNPEIQISGYGSPQAGSFWVQHVDQKIQIGWQNLPAQTTNIAVLRSDSADGPWSTVLTQEDPDVVGPYTIQIVDDSLGSAFYYELNAFAGSSSLATYGPVSLPPATQ